LAGISRQKVYADADRGEVVVKPCKCGSRWMGKIERSEARRYINHLQRSH
jgi:hypothetical protein